MFHRSGDTRHLQICQGAGNPEVEGTSCFRGRVFPSRGRGLIPSTKRASAQSSRELLPLPSLIAASGLCPPRSPEAVRAVPGAPRRGLEYGVRLCAPSTARPDARVLTGEGRGEAAAAHRSRSGRRGGDARPVSGVRLDGMQLFRGPNRSGRDRGWRRRVRLRGPEGLGRTPTGPGRGPRRRRGWEPAAPVA